MRVSLAQKPPLQGLHAGSAPPLLRPEGARVILGGHTGQDGLSAPIAPGHATLFGPRGACLAAADGPLFVCDTGHHRIMVWRMAPLCDGAPADFVIGHEGFEREGRNGSGAVGATTLNVPTGIAARDGVLAVADAWNHRVLLWFGYPTAAQQPPDIVLGQADFCSGLANRGGAPAADTLNWCYGVAFAGSGLVVCDTGNRRVLVWRNMPGRNGQPADLVLGQADFSNRDDSAGGQSALGMRWPHAAITAPGVPLAVADAGRNRVMIWNRFPDRHGAPCDRVLGQEDTEGQDPNQGNYLPHSGCLNMPYGIAAMGSRLVVADTANSRLLGWDTGHADSACCLSGQAGFTDKGDNRWRAARRDSLCWPYGVSVCGPTAVIADSGNNRVLLWDGAA